MKINKKGLELPFNTIAVAILVLIVVFVLIMTYTNLFGKQREIISGKIDGLEEEVEKTFEKEEIGILIPLIIFAFFGGFFLATQFFYIKIVFCRDLITENDES